MYTRRAQRIRPLAPQPAPIAPSLARGSLILLACTLLYIPEYYREVEEKRAHLERRKGFLKYQQKQLEDTFQVLHGHEEKGENRGWGGGAGCAWYPTLSPLLFVQFVHR